MNITVFIQQINVYKINIYIFVYEFTTHQIFYIILEFYIQSLKIKHKSIQKGSYYKTFYMLFIYYFLFFILQYFHNIVIN